MPNMKSSVHLMNLHWLLLVGGRCSWGDDWDLRVRDMGMIALGHHMNVCQVRVEALSRVVLRRRIVRGVTESGVEELRQGTND